MMRGGLAPSAKAANEVVVAQSQGTLPPVVKDPAVVGPIMRSTWTEYTALAERYKWTSVPGGNNLHRNVIFRDLTVPSTVMSALDIPREEGLWRWLASLEPQGVRALAIPHNSNASKGLMFPTADSSGAPLTADYARLRARFEPLIEMMQVKGNSEVHRALWGGDEFAGFENADSISRVSGRSLRWPRGSGWG